MSHSTKKKGPKDKPEPAQQYDTTFKDWIRTVAREVLPVLLPGAVYEKTLDVEAIKPTMRMDKVFKVLFPERPSEKENIIDIEFQTSYDPDLAARLLVYNAILYYENRLPVISLVIYPFQTTLVGSPLIISSGKRPILTFDFIEIALFQEQAEYYLKEHIIGMYPVLPTMRGVDHVLMRTAMDELFEFCRGREEIFAEQFVWMEVLLERTETIAVREKERIRRELQVYDSLWENHPRVKQIRAEVAASMAQIDVDRAQIEKRKAQLEAQIEKRKAQLEADRAQVEKKKAQLEAQIEKKKAQLEAQLEADRTQIEKKKAQLEKKKAQLEAQGEVHGLQHAIVTVVRVRYPALTEMAQQKVAHLNKLDALNFLFEQISAQTTEDGVRALLLPTVA